MWQNTAEASGTPGVDDDGNGYVDDIYGYDFAADMDGNNGSDPLPVHPHGTHVSGTIGAEGNNSVGIVGVNQHVKIMAVKIFRPDGGAYDSDILEAIDYVLTMKGNGVNIVAINASYGGYGGSQEDPMNIAIRSLGDQGIVFVAAAGNEYNNNDGSFQSFPASYNAANIISVAATDQNDTLAWFSNRGEFSVDIAAPGVNILSTTPSAFAHFTGETTLFSDDVESGEGNWTTEGTTSWAITSAESNSTSHSWTDSPDGNYTDDANASLVYGADIDLSGSSGVIGVGFKIKGEAEIGYDGLYIEVSGDSGSTWTTINAITGSTSGEWVDIAFAIPANLRTAHFRMRFRFVSNCCVDYDGYYLDDIRIGTIAFDSEYQSWAGTSMAAPHVTGSVALVAAEHSSDSMLTRISRILSGGDAIASLEHNVSSGSRLNVNGALTNTALKPLLATAQPHEGVWPGNSLTVSGINFGSTAGQGNFSDTNQTTSATVTSWSSTSITVTVPSRAGKFFTIKDAAGVKSVNALKLSAWSNAGYRDQTIIFDASTAQNGCVYTFGGRDLATGELLKTAEKNCLDTSGWASLPDMPEERVVSASASAGGKLYVFGGWNGSDMVDTVYVFDPASSSWSTKHALPTPIAYGAAVELNGDLYYVGGITDSNVTNKLLHYNAASDSWEEKAPMSTTRGAFASATVGGKLYVFGGIKDEENLTQSVEVYDPSTDRWSSIADLPFEEVLFHAVPAPDGKIWVYRDGFESMNGDGIVSVWEYNPADDSWTDISNTILDPSAWPLGIFQFVPSKNTVMHINTWTGAQHTCLYRTPDLVVQNPTIDNASITEGGSVVFSAVVKNQGTGPAKSTTVKYFISTDASISTADTQVGSQDTVSALGATATDDISQTLTLQQSAGSYYLGACVVSVDGESDTMNQCSSAVALTINSTSDDSDNNDSNNNSSSGGGCTYNPNANGFDAIMIFMLLFSLLYPVKKMYRFDR
jgi:subtilisin family serine protease